MPQTIGLDEEDEFQVDYSAGIKSTAPLKSCNSAEKALSSNNMDAAAKPAIVFRKRKVSSPLLHTIVLWNIQSHNIKNINLGRNCDINSLITKLHLLTHQVNPDHRKVARRREDED